VSTIHRLAHFTHSADRTHRCQNERDRENESTGRQTTDKTITSVCSCVSTFASYTLDNGEQSFFRVLNAALRSDDTATARPFLLYTRLLNAALDLMPHVTDTFYRGVGLPLGTHYEKGTIKTELQFNSTTTDVSVISGFTSGCDTTMFTMKGSFPDIAAFSAYAHEQEVLVPAGTRFKVEHVTHV